MLNCLGCPLARRPKEQKSNSLLKVSEFVFDPPFKEIDVTNAANNVTDRVPDFAKGTAGLLPAIAQDASSGRVLMMAWMNEESWKETLSTGNAVYFSRSRGKLWRKGETSGHQQKVTEIRVDCDADTILLKVQQTGAACHNGFESCFYRCVEPDGTTKIADQQMVDPESVYGKTTAGEARSDKT